MTVVAVLGTGLMGAPMAANLCRAGLTVRVWNRSRNKAEPLAEHGAEVLDRAADAVPGADVVLTMLADAAAVESVLADGVLAALTPEMVWVQASTVGVSATEDLIAVAERAGVPFVDAPVLGTRKPAEDGALTVLASGPDEVRDRCAPVFDAIGARTTWVGAAGAGSRLKLVANSWVLALTNATAETVALAGALDVDPQQFLDAISGGPLDVGYAHVKSAAMVSGEYPASFSARLAAKDARLVLDAAGAGLDLGGVEAALRHLTAADDAGHGDDDMAALYLGVRRAG